jgi:hypothetical protein
MRKLIRAPQAKPCRTPGCGKLTYRGLCIECERRQRREKRAVHGQQRLYRGAA